jgi:hypothetical protein
MTVEGRSLGVDLQKAKRAKERRKEKIKIFWGQAVIPATEGMHEPDLGIIAVT